MKIIRLLLLFFNCNFLFAANVVNVYVWGGEIPKKIVQEFEKETGIKVNFSTYDSNETLYAKLKASSQPIYDVILPSGYYVERMIKRGMLTPLDHHQLPNINNLDTHFISPPYDVGNHYSVPVIWGITGIFFNKNNLPPPQSWQQLWDKKWRNQLMLLDDAREVFAIALMSLSYHPNDNDPAHITAAYHHLLKLVPNIKLFASDSIQAILIDEDARIGTAWNGDAFKAQRENPNIQFIFPEEGYVMWVDCLAIPKNAPHLKEAIAFINFILKPSISAKIALLEGHAITNAMGRLLLPETIRTNPLIYPSQAVLKKGYFQRDISEKNLALYNQYWQQLKLAF